MITSYPIPHKWTLIILYRKIRLIKRKRSDSLRHGHEKTPDFLVVIKNVDDLYLCWWGEAVNRRSDLLLNPDLLQIRTMGDYEGDYCAADLLVWRDPLLCGQFIDLDALEKGRFCRRPYYKTITNSLSFFNTKLNILLAKNMKRVKMAVQLLNS